jgi:hypothetical protein
MYGTLSQAMKSSSLLPPPIPPYITLSIDSVLRQLRAVKGVDYYCPSQNDTAGAGAVIWSVESPPKEINAPSSRRSKEVPTVFGRNSYPSHKPEEVHIKLIRHNCRIEHHLKGLLTATESKIEGLKLSNYLRT